MTDLEPPSVEITAEPSRDGAAGEGETAIDALPVAIAQASPEGLAALAAAIDFAGQALSPATLRAYRSDWQHFCGWCRAVGWSPLPAEPTTVAAYLASLAATHSTSALVRRLAALSRAHRLAVQVWPSAHPAVRNTLRGIGRKHGKPPVQAAALATEEIRPLVATCDLSLVGLRDRALLLIGYAGALRRSELVAIEREHLTLTGEGLRLLIPRSKGDQTGKGVNLGIARGASADTCPVKALEAWLTASKCEHGPVFRAIDMRGVISRRALHPDAVRQILGKRIARAGLIAPIGERLSPHGLRAGCITQALINGARDEQVMDHSRHKDLRTMRGYVRRAKLVRNSPSTLLDL